MENNKNKELELETSHVSRIMEKNILWKRDKFLIHKNNFRRVDERVS